MSDARQKTDMSDELTTIARKSYGESAFVVRISPGFMLYVERKPVWYHEAASQEDAFRELKMKLETMAMFTELQNAKRAAEDAAETKRMVDEFSELAKRAYPNCIPVFDAATRTFTVTRGGETLVTDTGVTTFDAYRAVMPKLRDEAVALSTALTSFNALPELMNEVFGPDAQLIAQTSQPCIVVTSQLGDCKHAVFASSASANTRDAANEAHSWLTALKTDTPSFTRIDAEVRRTFGPKARFAPNGNAGYAAVREGDAELLVWNDSNFDKLLRHALAHLLCLPSKTVAASEATAAPERTTGVSNEVGVLDALNVQLHREAIRVCGVGAEIRAGENKEMPYVSVSSDVFYTMRESRATAIEAREALIERLRTMPTFVPPATNAAPVPTNDYLVWGSRDAITLTDCPAPINLSITNTTPEQKATPTMTPQTPAPTPIMDTVKADAEAAAWMLAGSQFVKLTKEPIVALLSRHLGPGDDSLRARIAAFLDTELGTAIVAAILSGGLSAMPAPPGSQAANINARLARELRVKSMATVGDAAVDLIAGPMRQVIAMYIAGAPAFPMALGDGADRPVVPSTVATAAEVTR